MMKELNQIEDIFSDNQLSNLIKDRLKETRETQNSIKINDLNSFSKKIIFLAFLNYQRYISKEVINK